MKISRKYSRCNIAVCIPTYNESDTISRTTLLTDKGLQTLSKYGRVFIVNVDNSSPDDTKTVFLNTETVCHKVSLLTNKKGKGANLIKFMKWCDNNNIDVAATIDSDVTTSDKNWVVKLLSPLISKKADYVVPRYQRSRFEGSTTNHFAYPLMHAFFGQYIRQPLGGEFGFNRKLIKYYLKQKTTNEILGYGIDIFMTIHALGLGCKVKSVFLGKKLHKPSFPKIYRMFQEVFIAAMFSLGNYNRAKNFNPFTSVTDIDAGTVFKHEKQVKIMYQHARKDYRANLRQYSRFFPNDIFSEGETRNLSGDQWVQLLSSAYQTIMKNRGNRVIVRQLSGLVTPVFIFRTIFFWKMIKKSTPNQVEALLATQADDLKTAFDIDTKKYSIINQVKGGQIGTRI